ncbi:MAG: class I SAM-dependent methyltransferase [Hyphomonadaceae bacterium]|nr:class I SAM-dependent methyltransferase [Hyphomonadaceae bacterium]
MTWAEYWSGETTLYVSARHKGVHYETVARDIVACLPGRDARVVDYGCGEALSAHLVAEACAQLFLCDSTQAVRERLAARYAGRANIDAIAPAQFAQLPSGTIDMIVANSVIQYLSASEFQHFLTIARDKLRPAGRLVIADVIPRQIGPLQDAAELLKFAAANGFLLSAGSGLVKSFFSSYRRVRQRLGLLKFNEAEILNLLTQSGFVAHRRHPNIGHNAQRMTFLAFAGEAVPAG